MAESDDNRTATPAMPEPKALLNGEFISASQAAVPVFDAGFVLGTTVTEQIRTFAGALFRCSQHLARLQRSLEIIRVDCGYSADQMLAWADELVAHNHGLLGEGDDLGLAIFVTPGPYPTLAMGADSGPTLCMHTYPLPFALWAESYQQGESLVTPSVRQVSADCWPRELKCRSRMHYYLADREAREIDPRARALLLDDDGFITEATTASVICYNDATGLVSPPQEKILPGISVAVVRELAAELDIPWAHCDLTPQDVARADEVFLAGTTPCLLPVVRFNGQPTGNGTPGNLFSRLLALWSDRVGIDISAQARRFSVR